MPIRNDAKRLKMAETLAYDSCDVWYHTQCEDVRDSIYEQLGNSSCSWECHHCGAPNYSSIIFNSSSNNMSNFYEPLTPSYISDTSSYSASMSPGNPQFSSSPTTTRKAAPTKKTTKPLRLLNVNCRSIKNKKEHFWNMIDTTKPDIIFGTESWLTSEVKDNEVFPPGYNIFRNDRETTVGGGVFLGINSDFICSSQPELGTDCEIVWAKIQIHGQKPVHLASYYRPHVDDESSLTELSLSLDKIPNTVKPFITTHIYFHVTAVWIWSRPYNYAHQLYYR